MDPVTRRLRRTARRTAGALFRVSSHPIGGGAGLDPRNLLPRDEAAALAEAIGGRVVMVTGASSGIGEATARQAGAAGAEVLLVARGAEALERIAAEIGPNAHAMPCDLTDFDAIDALADQAVAAYGGVDVLVNNAGRSIRRSVESSTERFHDFERTMQLNYFASVRLVLRLLPSMRGRERAQIINVSSAGVQTRTPRFSGYIASKAALEAFSDSLQAEVNDTGLRITTISMPLVRTPMISPTEHYEGFPSLSPEEAGRLVTEAMVGRPRRVAPPFAHLVGAIDKVSPEAMDAIRNRGYRMFED